MYISCLVTKVQALLSLGSDGLVVHLGIYRKRYHLAFKTIIATYINISLAISHLCSGRHH